MRKNNQIRKIFRLSTAAILLLCCVASLEAGPVRLAFHDTVAVGGKQLDYPIYADSSLTGLGVISYECEFTYSTDQLSFLGATKTGTLTAAWDSPVFNEISPGRIRITAAGAASLSGTGKMVILRFAMQGRTYSTGAYVTFQSALLNEGSPAVSTRNGYIQINAIPTITISPDTWQGTRSETKQFSVYGGKAPFAWSTTSPSVAGISSAGLLTALSVGMTKVVCTDSAGIVDTSGIVEVRGMKLNFRDTSRYQGQMLDLPIYVSSLTGLNIAAGEISINFNNSLVTPVGTVEDGTMLASYGPTTMMVGNGTLKLSFAGSVPLSGSGVLVYLRLKTSTVNSGVTGFSFANAVFNETLLANTQDAYVTVLQLPTLTVTPAYATTMVAGDSLLFTVSGGTPPYTWSVSDTALLRVSSLGMARAKSGGSATVSAQDAIGAKGRSGVISVYDFRLSIPDTAFLPASVFDVPIYVTSNAKGFQSFSMQVNYTNNPAIQCTGVISAGTLSEGFLLTSSFPTGSVKIAAAIGGSGVTAGGLLLKLHFAMTDSTVVLPRINLTLSEVLFNEGVPLPLSEDGYFDIANRSIFGITPPTASLKVPRLGGRDSAVFVIRNSGTTHLTGSLWIDWPGSSEFTAVPSSIDVLPADSTKVRVYYLPLNLGTDSTILRISTNDPFHSTVLVPLRGIVLLSPALQIDLKSISFGNVQVGKWRDTTVTLSNSGSDTLRITSIATGEYNFAARPVVTTLAPGHSVGDTLRFTPTSVGAVTARFLIVGNAATSPDTIYVSGTGTPTMGVARNGDVPHEFLLEQNFPNPFNPSTTIWYSLPSAGRVKIQICDILGQVVADLVDGEQSAGWQSVVWNAQAASGMYFYRMEAVSMAEPVTHFVQVRKMLLMK